ncbi:MAG TPA: hypothetical protein VHB27_15570 [Rhodopila sp.]|uniref:hypothetical protein n=1 Tax=Rhodopila sp. TaxID=2480087 RepID=UPI002B7B5B96|nr:hypothetical protein [Rhodopila sp.]HVY16643.1 hypothetical protein [Rhodopila sp.]
MDQQNFSPSIFDCIVAFLLNLFLPTNDHDPVRARAAVLEALAEYGPRSNRELRLAALSLAFSLGALDALSRATDQDLTLNQVLRLRSSANTLHRSARQADETLADERREPEIAPQETTQPNPFLPMSTEPHDLIDFARSMGLLSRQQRRRLEREEAKVRRRQEIQARQAARDTHKGRQPDKATLTGSLLPASIVSAGTAGAGADAANAVA